MLFSLCYNSIMINHKAMKSSIKFRFFCCAKIAILLVIIAFLRIWIDVPGSVCSVLYVSVKKDGVMKGQCSKK